MPIHIVNQPNMPWPHRYDQGRPTATRVGYMSRNELPAIFQELVEHGLYIIHDAAGYLCSVEDPAELATILGDEGISPGHTRWRLTGEDPEESRRKRLERMAQPAKPVRRKASKPAPDLEKDLGIDLSDI